MAPLTRAFALTLAVTSPAASALPQAGTHFKDESESYGVLFEHKDGSNSYQMAGGVAWLDFDADGDEDLVAVSADGRNGVFENKNDGTFDDVSQASGLMLPQISNSIGVSVADYNQDGLPDMYFTNSMANMLFRNNGDGTWTDVAPELGLDSSRWSSCSSWADWDRDGDLDLYVGNYVNGLHFPYHYGWENELYENQGTSANPAFVDVAPALGVEDSGVFGPSVPGFTYLSPEGEPTAGCTLSISTLDYDEDGDPDLMVGNDFGEWVLPNKQWRNDTPAGSGMVFTDVSSETKFDTRPHYNMGINGSDFDLDGDWDFYMTNLGDNLLLRDDGGVYVDATYSLGPVDGVNADGSELISSWGILWSDFDNDLYEDLFVCNGLIPAAGFISNDPDAPNSVWMNHAGTSFSRLPDAESGCGDTGAGRGVASCDLNRDGLIDFYTMNNGSGWVSSKGDACRLWINQGTLGDPSNGWIELRLHGWKSNLEAIGARLLADVGGKVLRRQVLADPVFLSSSSRTVHFGLGQNAKVDRLQIDWPAGVHQELFEIPAKRLYDLHEPRVTLDGLPAPTYQAGSLSLQFDLTNQTNAPQQVLALMFFRMGAGGPLIGKLELGYTVAAATSESLVLPFPMDAALHSVLQGLEVERLVYLVADGAVDSRRLTFVIP